MRSPIIPPIEFRKPATIRLALDLEIGLPGDITSITGWLRKVAADGSLIATGEISCLVESYAASGANPAGWSISCPSAALEIGDYAMIALVLVGADTIATEPAFIRLVL
jgi:hypothetical protein